MSVVLAACMLACPSRGAAEVKVSERIEYYLLDGSTPEELRQQFAMRGPVGRAGAVAAITRHTLSMQYWRRQVGDACEAYGIRVDIDITIHLPRWRPRQAPLPALSDQWRRLEHALRIHEQGHRDNGIDAARALHARLRDIATAPDCRVLKSAFDTARRDARQSLQAREDAFDRETDHGRRWLQQEPAAP